jgi:hypothetical protein
MRQKQARHAGLQFSEKGVQLARVSHVVREVDACANFVLSRAFCVYLVPDQ